MSQDKGRLRGVRFRSTAGASPLVDLREAVLRGLAPDGGLYWPTEIPKMESSGQSVAEIGVEVCRALFAGALDESVVERLVHEACDFPAPAVELAADLHVLELFHGPSLAFKDFGARFMARLMGHFVTGADQKLRVLVATSGDTGGAVAMGFLGVPGIEVVILYPKGRVSPLQEKQLTTLGRNIRALEVEGSFDDCQRMVKAAFRDSELARSQWLTSANSINIARLIPQSFYFWDARRQLERDDLSFVVPSGNFGNLSAGLLARKMGLPCAGFIAATNANHVVPDYLQTGAYAPATSVATISNAMDVGAPSNFDRMVEVVGAKDPDEAHTELARQVRGVWFDDDATRDAIAEVHRKFGYTIDPHGAVAYLAAKSLGLDHAVVLETAHPAKFLPVMEGVLGKGSVDVPERLARLSGRLSQVEQLPASDEAFKAWLGR